jgi:predicted phosphate transport protein (TIGR00153 family)
MVGRLIPKDIKFFDLFEAAGVNLSTAAYRLQDLFANFDRLEGRIAEIQALEKESDEIDRKINDRLEEAFVAPFDREDIHELTVQVDDVVDSIQAVAESLLIYDIREPTTESRLLADILALQGAELAQALQKLEKMKDLNGHLARIHELEHQADGISRAAVGRLFRERLDPLDVIKLRDVYTGLEEAIDAAEDAAEAIERMVHKRV